MYYAILQDGCLLETGKNETDKGEAIKLAMEYLLSDSTLSKRDKDRIWSMDINDMKTYLEGAGFEIDSSPTPFPETED